MTENQRPTTMSEDILAQTAPRASSSPQKISAIGVILVIILAIVLVLLGERLIFDLNRWINPKIEKQYSYESDYNKVSYPANIGQTLSAERNVLAPGISIYYPTKEKGAYMAYKLLIHAAFVMPAFLLVFLLYYLVKIKQQKEGWRAAIYAYMIFGFWMIIHLLIETGDYITSQYKSAAIYIILGALAVILTPLAIFLQKKHSEKAV